MRFVLALLAALMLLVGCSKSPESPGGISGTVHFESPQPLMQARSALPDPEIFPGEVLLGFFGDMDDSFVPPLTVSHSTITLTLDGNRNSLGTYTYTFHTESESETWAVIRLLEASGTYAAVIPNYVMRLTNASTAPEHLWHYELIGGIGGDKVPETGAGVRVAVVDTGGVNNHPDIAFVDGYNFVGQRGPDYSPVATDHHGMHVAGTIGANGTVFKGVAPNADLIAARVAQGTRAKFVDVFDAIWWASGGTITGVPNITNAARVVNVSLGAEDTQCIPAAASLFQLLSEAGVVVVTAAGNHGGNSSTMMPANCPGVITVGAVDVEGKPTSYSGYGDAVDVVAPGGTVESAHRGVLSTIIPTGPGPSLYGWSVGTSMAAPHVAGLVALMLEKNPTLDTPSVLNIIRQAAIEVEDCVRGCGAGLINVPATLNLTPTGSGPPTFMPLPTRANAFYPAFVVALKTCKTTDSGCSVVGPSYTYGIDVDRSKSVAVSQFSSSEPFAFNGVNPGDYVVMAWRPYRLGTTLNAPINVLASDDFARIPGFVAVSDGETRTRVQLWLAPYQLNPMPPDLLNAMTSVVNNTE